MKANMTTLAGTILVTVALLSSCSGYYASEALAKDKSVHGNLKVSIPALAPWIIAAVGQSGGRDLNPSSRALTVADRASFVVTQGATQVATWTEDTSYDVQTASSSYLSSPALNLLVGSYTLSVSVFNTANSSTVPVVTGSAGFSITDGATTNATVICTPVSPTGVTVGTPLLGQNLGTPWNVSGATIVLHGAERWYAFTAGGSNTVIAVTASSGSNAVPQFGAFDTSGHLLTMNNGGFSSTQGLIYYLCAADTGGTAASMANRSVDLSVVTAAVPTYAVTYDANGATGGTVPTSQTKTNGISLTLAANSGSLVRTGYTFAGWNTAADGSGTTYAVGAAYTADAAVDLYAKWTALPVLTFSNLTANGTSGTVTTTTLTLTFDVEPTTLALSDITVSGATKGTLSGTGTTRTLGISAITVANGANVTVALANPAGFTISPASRAVAIKTMLNLVSVPAGSFQRNATASNISTITTAFRMSEKEITRAQFVAMLGTDPSQTQYSSGTSDPVQYVNWYHAIAFCNKLSLAEGKSPVYSVTGVDFSTLAYESIPTTRDATWDATAATWANNGYRLPTEMEWEWAAMGATSDGRSGDIVGGVNTGGYTKGYAGSVEAAGAHVNIGNYAWYSGNSASTTHPVGTKTANELGLYDMSGNVWEWNWDWDAASYTPGLLTDDRGAASGTNRVFRGGSWILNASYCPVARRSGSNPYGRSGDIGFRVVRP